MMNQPSAASLAPRSRAGSAFTALLAAALLAFAGMTLTAAPDAATDIELAWQRNWKNYARRCVKIRDLYFTCASFETIYPSSKGLTAAAYRQKTAKEITERPGANVKVKKNLVKPAEEIDAAVKTLPEIAVGHYGSIHSAEVVEIIGPDEMIVAGIWLIDPQQVQADRAKDKEKLLRQGADKSDLDDMLDHSYEVRDSLIKRQSDRSFRSPVKLRGFSTVGVAKGERWVAKPAQNQIAIVGVEVGEVKVKFRKTSEMLVAIPADSFMKPITDEKEFLALLAARGFTKQSFVALVQEEKKINASDERLADALIFAKLDGRSQEKEPEEKPVAKPKKPSF